ncbi:MAG: DedD protein [Acidobacteriaceae bacterium]|jgi:cell division septation protein DedD|nr:DedD protein [Acidobacteriaceae bacterium]
MAAGKRRGAGEKVLESRHVIGLFLLMLVFSAIFFTLGYVMGRSQYDGQVRAASTQHDVSDAVVKKSDSGLKRSAAAPATAAPAPEKSNPNSDWEFYSSDKQKESGDHLKPVSPATVSSSAKTAPQNNGDPKPTAAVFEAPKPPQSGGYTLQVMAVRRESDALDLAKRLQKNKFPAFVLTPQGNKYYRVQVGPYSDKKSAEAAKKGLEGAGFRAIVKRG